MRVPRFRYSRFYFAAVLACLLSIALISSFAHAQGFTGGITSGKTKKKVVLRRKLPSAIKLTATSFAVNTTAHDKNQADVAQALADVLETDLLKNDHCLKVEKNSPAGPPMTSMQTKHRPGKNLLISKLRQGGFRGEGSFRKESIRQWARPWGRQPGNSPPRLAPRPPRRGVWAYVFTNRNRLGAGVSGVRPSDTSPASTADSSEEVFLWIS